MNIFFTITLAAISLLFALAGLLWFFGKGGGFMGGWNSKSDEEKARYDQKAFLRFNGLAALAAAALGAISALLVFIGIEWAFTAGLAAIIVVVLVPNFYSLRSKRFIKPDAPPDPATTDPKKAREKKAKGIIAIVAVLAVGIPLGWLMLEGVRPVNVSIEDGNLRIASIYGTTVALDDILEIVLDERAMADIGSGGRRMGHGTANNWRGNFGAGLLMVQNPSEGPTIRIERRSESAIFISFADPAETIVRYHYIVSNLN